MSERAPLAVIGYAYRAPGVGRKGLWEFLEEGKSAWSAIPGDRFNPDAYHHSNAEKPGFISSEGGHFLLDDIYAFDPSFFKISAEEATSMDPQHRILLESAFEAAENAGLTLSDLRGSNAGVFAAGVASEYSVAMSQDMPTSSKYMALGGATTMFANRLSYSFGLTGPSVTMDAACASSSYALHLACQNILAGECSTAFVGGANLLNGPMQWSGLDTMGTLSPAGKCFSYDIKASGFGRGEGAACIIIKRLSEALARGDPVRAVIRNTVCNHAGRTQGISMPSRASQEELLTRLHRDIGVQPSETTFVEGHGTGTLVGDPIEASAISSVVGTGRSPSNPVYIGSVKSNLGHLEGASGLISVIKSIMMLERGVMLPNANFTEFNPKIEGLDRLTVLTKSATWPSGARKRVCVSNFGFGGSNAAILLEEAPNSRPQEKRAMSNGKVVCCAVDSVRSTHIADNDGSVVILKNQLSQADDCIAEHLFVFSAQSINSLETYVSSFVGYLEVTPNSSVFAKDIAFTLGQRRTHFAHRIAIAANSAVSLKDQLQSIPRIIKSGETSDPIIAFAFTGQGSQYFQMSAGLRKYSKFQDTILAAEQQLFDLGATWSLTEELDKDELQSRVNDVDISQPACTAIQLALVVLLQSWGIVPAVVLGHSSGEIAAAFAAGYISLKAAIAIAYFRGIAASKVLKDAPVQGAMLAVGTGAEKAQELVDFATGYAVIAAINSPDSVTISGDVAAIQQIQERAGKQGLFVRRLKVGVAYHSRHMERVADSYLASIQPFCCPDRPSKGEATSKPWLISSVTGQKEPADTVSASYWIGNLLQPVQYLKAVEALFSLCDDFGGEARLPNVVVEIGPHSALQSPTKQILGRITSQSGQNPRAQPTYLPSLQRGKVAATSLLGLTGKLFAMGSELDFTAINQTEHSPVQIIKDLPSYAWNKTSRYIHRSRVAANKLYNGGPYSRLLGWKSPYSEGNEQAFRNVFTLDDLPWIRDHVAAGEILFPFSGFVSLAVEGFRSINSTLSHGVAIQELHVTTSLIIEEEQRVDITTKFRPAITGTETTSSTAWAFEILAWSDSHGWTRHSYGIIEADQSHESLSRSPEVQSALNILHDKSLRQHDTQNEYALLHANNGLTYGPTFRNMVSLRRAPNATVQTIALRTLEPDAHTLPQASPVTIDPPTLDAIFHCVGAMQERTGPGLVVVPSYCLRWRISNHIVADAGREFSIVGRLLGQDEMTGTMQMAFVIFDTSSASSPPMPVAEIGPVKLQCIARTNEQDLRFPESYTINHTPYVDLIDSHVLSKMVAGRPADVAELRQRRDLDHAAIYFLSRMLKETANEDLSGLPPHLMSFLGWAKRTVMSQPPVITDPTVVDRVSSSNDTGKMVCAVGAELTQILRGESQPLKIMLEDGLLQRSYEQHDGCNRVNEVAARYIARLAECNPGLNVLEIGGGTASATLPILEAIQDVTKGLASTFHYTFTDISAAFFDNARSKLSQWTEQMTYSKLDISHDPLLQGFDAESYDVILASNVLHATPDIVATLNNARAVLRPNGKLVLMEAVQDAAPHFLPFVLLDGWWLSKDSYRSPSDGPLLGTESWSDLLEANGFSGVEGHVDDHPGQPEHLFSAMWSTKCEIRRTADQEEANLSVTVYHHFDKDEDVGYAKTVSDHLTQGLGSSARLKHLLQADNAEDSRKCVILDSYPRSMMSDISSEMFYTLKGLLMQASGLLWVLPDKSHPDASIVTGLLRSLRLESSSSKFALLEIPYDAHGADAIARVTRHMIWGPSSAINHEQEYSLIDNQIHVPRFQHVEAPKETFIAEAGGSVKEEQNIWHADDAIEMTVDAVGSPDSVFFRHSDILDTELGQEEIVVRVGAVGVNFRDLLLVLGSLSWHTPGLEGAGEVVRVGSQVKDLHIGDRVFYIVHEAGMANFVRMPILRARKLPVGLDLMSAATMPVAYSTAITSIIDIGRLRRGETVLIHSASGAVGQACVMIAQQLGARIFATAGSAEKRGFVAETFGIPTTQIFSSRTPEFKDLILQATDDRGVDVIVNSLSSHLLQQTWDLIAENGRFIEIGKKDLLENRYLPMRHFDKNVTFSAVDLRKIAAARPEAVKEWLSSIVHMVQGQEITPIRPVTSIPISQVKTGLRKLQSGQSIGKIVVTLEPCEKVKVERPSPLKTRLGNLLRSDATYLITGGTGGLGRALASWMIKKGAKNLVLLGRSSTPRAKVIELLKRYEGTDVCVRALSCDVGSRTDLIRTIEALTDLPQAATFVNATSEDWQQVMGPKVKGAWNLHELFPNLDFFVSLSSMLGIVGNAGTSLYAGTSTFLEAFSQYRIRLGLPAVAVHLPAVQGVGFVVEQGIVEQTKLSLGATITEDQFYTLVEGAIIGPASGLNSNGRSLSWMLASDVDLKSLAWAQFNPLSVMPRQQTDSSGSKTTRNEGKSLEDLLKRGSPELLMSALGDKVSSITMIDRDEVTPNRTLKDYGLDSLFSLELRNWIRRNLSVDVALKDIITARDLQALVDRILPLMKSTEAVSTLAQNKILKDAAAGSELISDTSSPSADGGVSQFIPLSPFQRLLLTLDGFEEFVWKTKTSFRHHFENAKVHVTATRVEGALRKLISHHPILRARLQRRNSDRTLVHEIPSASQASFLFHLHTSEQPVQMGEIPDATARSRSERAPDATLIADLTLSPGESWIALTSPYIIIDDVSWNIICKDLEDLLMDASSELSSSGSFARWVQSQSAPLSCSIDTHLPRADSRFWNLQQTGTRDHTTVERQLVIDSDVTERLLGACNIPLNTKPVELLMTAVLLSFRETFSDRGFPALYYQLDGREIGDTSLNAWSRTVGCLTTLVPIIAAIRSGAPVEEAVATVKDAYRADVRDGSRAFASCMLGQNPLRASDIEVLFSFRDGKMKHTGTAMEKPQLLGLLGVSAEHRERRLYFNISYSSDIAHQDRLLSWTANLETALKESASQLPYKEPRLTVTETHLLEARSEELEGIQKHLQSIGIDIPNVESILPCAPVQEGILLAQLKSQPRRYWERLTLRITSNVASECVEVDKVAAAWKGLCMAQPMLRTVFMNCLSSAGAFQQVILKKTEPSISHATIKKQTGLKSILDSMEEPQFTKAQPPHHLHLTQESTSVVYASFHMNHALIDYRSLLLIRQQLSEAYKDMDSIPKGLDFSRYISWVRNHRETAKDYWKAYLTGTRPCLISVLDPVESRLLDKASPPYFDVSFDQARLIHVVCHQHGVTVANLMQVAWGMVLRQCTGLRSVTFGCGQSQSGAVEGDETTLGPLLANIICRVDLFPGKTPLQLLQRAREDSLRAFELPSYSMGEIHEAAGLGRLSLFDTAMTIARPPPESSNVADGIRVEFLLSEEDSSEYAITVGISQETDRIEARLWYDATRVSRSLVAQLGSLLAAAVAKIANDPDKSNEALESSIGRPSAAFSTQDVAPSVFREAASQCEVAARALEDVYPCSPLQQQHFQLSVQQKTGRGFDQYVFRVPNHVSTTRLHDAWDAVAAASPTLRTRIVSLRQGDICQVTVRAMPAWNEETSLSDYLQWDKDLRIRFGGPLCRFGEVYEPDGNGYFVLSLHPAIHDSWTLSLVLTAVKEAYDSAGELPAPFPPFSAYIRSLSSRQNAQSAEEVLRAWPSWSHEASLQFPHVPHSACEANVSNSRLLDIPMPIRNSGDEARSKTPIVLCAAWALCLSRLSGISETCFGMHVDGRDVSVEGIARMNGPVAAVIPCAIDMAMLTTGESLLGAIRENIEAVTPFFHASSSIERSTGNGMAQSFRNILIVENDHASVRALESPDVLESMQTRLSASSLNGARLVTRCRIMSNESLRIEMQYDEQVISSEDIDILLKQYNHSIMQLLCKATYSLIDLDPISDYERSLFRDWNRTSPGQIDACIHDQIRDIAKRQPTAPAICSWDYDLDRGQLDDLSDRMAILLQKHGVRAGTTVPYVCEKSTIAAVVMLGILKAGGALVAMDLDHPAERLATILTDVGASTIITSSALSERAKAKVNAKNTVIVDMERVRSLPPGGPETVGVQASDTCYVIYTSGSTGRPKGIVLSHSNLATSVHHNRALFGMTAATRTLQFANFIFDAVMYEVFMTLISGGCVCIPNEEERLNDITGAIQRMRVNYGILSPSIATVFSPAEVPTLRTLCLCGESFSRDLVERWKTVRLINGYGPAETTVSSSQCVLSPSSSRHHLNVGRPVACRYWVVDPVNHNRLVAIGCPGELLIEGPVVGQGYLADAERTTTAFIEPPTWTSDFESLNLSSQRWYKTGDLVTQTADGSVIIQGRKGTQVKLAGQRIELEEIEHHLGRLADPGWRLTAELIRPSDRESDPYLAVFFTVPSLNSEITGQETPSKVLPPLAQKASILEQALSSRLPAYMVPQFFIRLNRLPLTSSSKTDRQSLRKLASTLSPEQLGSYSGSARLGKAPYNDINGEAKVNHLPKPEFELRKLWSQGLDLPIERIKGTDNFFDLRGSSVRAMRLVNSAHRAGFVLTVQDVFTKPILSDMAAAMRPTAKRKVGSTATHQKACPASPSSSFPRIISSPLMTYLRQLGFAIDDVESVAVVTDVQADMAAIAELDGEELVFTFSLHFAAGIEAAHIIRSCERTIGHHPVLRTVFVQYGAILKQVVLKSPPKGMVLSFQQGDEDEDDYIGMRAVYGDKLPQFCLTMREGKCHRLRLKIRHALYDAVSMAMILEDLHAAYTQQPLSGGPRFHDWVSYVESLDIAASRKFWTEALHGSSMTRLVPPTSSPTSGVPCSDGIAMRVPIPTSSYGTPSSVLQAAWALVLSRVTGKQDITFGVPNTNRMSAFPDVDRVPGPCLNILPNRVCLDHANETSLGSLVARIQEQAVAAIPHQHVGFRDIMRNCTNWPPVTRWSSVLLYQASDMAVTSTSKFGEVDSAFSITGSHGQFSDLWIIAIPEASELSIQLSYSKRTLPEEKAKWIARLLQTILESVPAALEQPLHQIAPDQQSMPASVAVATVTDPPSQDGPAAQNHAPSRPPTAHTRTLVAEAWDEVGLVFPGTDGAKKVDTSMYCCGADLVTTMLLSRCYRRRGFSLSMQDCIDHPTPEGQARLVESRKEMKGEKEVHGKIEVDGKQGMTCEKEVDGVDGVKEVNGKVEVDGEKEVNGKIDLNGEE